MRAFPPDIEGGGEISVALLSDMLEEDGFRSHIVTFGLSYSKEQSKARIIERLRPRNVFWSFAVRTPGPIRSVLWHVIDSFNPLMLLTALRILWPYRATGILHTETIKDVSVSVWVAAAILRIPVIHTIHSYSLLCTRGSMFRDGRNCRSFCLRCRAAAIPRRLASRCVDTVVGVSHRTLDIHVTAGCFARSRKVVIPNPVLAPTSLPRALSHAPGEELVLGYLGRLDEIKGVLLLIAALKLMHSRRPVRLVVGGRQDGGFARQLVAASKELPIEWLGYVHPDDLLARVHMLVVPSLWEEPFGRIIIEAYLAGVPVVGSARGGITELVLDGKTGVLFEPADPASLVAAIERLATLIQAGAISSQAMQSITRDCDPQVVARRYGDLMDELRPS